MRNIIVLGIDLTSTAAKPSACLGLDSKLQLVYFGFLSEDSDILAMASFHLPEVIAIDAPLSLSASTKKGRACERQLAALGIPCYFTTEKSIIKKMVYRGIELKNKLATRGFHVIEVYPYASKVRLLGKTIPRKTTPQGINFLKEHLRILLPSLKPYLGMFDHNLCDAAIAAYTASLYCQNMADALGNNEEGLIFIPSARSCNQIEVG
jgi:predicted nuclease with RNAse H fold